MLHLERMRPAQERARHILDTEHGPLTIVGPTVVSTAERRRLELAARTATRTLLDQANREHLAYLEAKQAYEGAIELGLAAGDAPTPVDAPSTIGDLHHAVTLAHAIQTAPITPADPQGS